MSYQGFEKNTFYKIERKYLIHWFNFIQIINQELEHNKSIGLFIRQSNTFRAIRFSCLIGAITKIFIIARFRMLGLSKGFYFSLLLDLRCYVVKAVSYRSGSIAENLQCATCTITSKSKSSKREKLEDLSVDPYVTQPLF